MRPSAAMIDPEAEARRAKARARLAELLKDPQFRAIEGFPMGSDEDILALSDPPYYTACPNPFLPEIIAEWQQERETLRRKMKLEEKYQREPFAADVSEGKNDQIYLAHTYHTKVPHKAIMRYILHYTEPGDIVFDGFCGTGMTGVAAQLCGDKKVVEQLGYRVDTKGVIWDGEKAISRLGARKAVLNDLSPAATFIAYNYNTPVDSAAFEREANRILKEVERECGWMYETWHPNCEDPNRVKCKVNYTVWADVFSCPQCGNEMNFWDAAVDKSTWQVVDSWNCPDCGALLAKEVQKEIGALKAERVWELYYDYYLNQSIRRVKQVPAFINYIFGKKKFNKQPDSSDISLLEQIENSKIPYRIPTTALPNGDKTGDPRNVGVTNVHHFYTRRNLFALAAFAFKLKTPQKYIDVISTATVISRMYRFRSQNSSLGAGGGPLNGTLYIPSLSKEIPILKAIKEHITKSHNVAHILSNISPNSISTGSHTELTNIASNCMQYIFTDPPFGSNLIYSELNLIWEAWLNVFTGNKHEAVISNSQRKKLQDYQDLMTGCFKEAYRILRPGHWITVEFHNSKNAVWNSIQEALLSAGFVIADVRTFDKQQGSYNQVNSKGAVKNDLIISAYKPNGNLEERFRLHSGTEDSVWEFVRYHLGKLNPVEKYQGNVVVNAERQAFLLFDRMVAFHIQRSVMVPLSAPEFYAGLQQRFIPRDGMYFLPEQVTEYDRAVLDSKGVVQLSLFVTDEKTAIQWLRQQLDISAGGQPQTHADLNPKFKLALHQAKHEKAPELIEILEQNFLQDEEGKWYLPDHNKASDLERVRQRSLLREFNEYASGTGRLRQFRTEAVRAGFADAFKRQAYDTIIKVAGRLPEDVLREDPDLLMYFDSATLRKK